ncbi:unnamed protein product [Gordionus sp. m RMFG-2023]|uniref:uncharacterized protein LOC135926944 n=1 Tax=Gordionus sp. m RMFG-2023 TaxID=3053472 RepID=UPI0030E42A1F
MRYYSIIYNTLFLVASVIIILRVSQVESTCNKSSLKKKKDTSKSENLLPEVPLALQELSDSTIATDFNPSMETSEELTVHFSPSTKNSLCDARSISIPNGASSLFNVRHFFTYQWMRTLCLANDRTPNSSFSNTNCDSFWIWRCIINSSIVLFLGFIYYKLFL